jgi:beta-glucosidase
MKNTLLITAAFSLSVLCASAEVKHQNDIDPKVSSLLAKMTLEEKVGQMTNLTVDVISKTNASGKIIEPHEIDEQKLEERILKYHIGSFQNVAGHAYFSTNYF